MHRNVKSIRIGKTVIPAHAIHWQFSRSQDQGSPRQQNEFTRNFALIFNILISFRRQLPSDSVPKPAAV